MESTSENCLMAYKYSVVFFPIANECQWVLISAKELLSNNKSGHKITLIYQMSLKSMTQKNWEGEGWCTEGEESFFDCSLLNLLYLLYFSLGWRKVKDIYRSKIDIRGLWSLFLASQKKSFCMVAETTVCGGSTVWASAQLTYQNKPDREHHDR